MPDAPAVSPAPNPAPTGDPPLTGPFISYSRRDLPFVRRLGEALRGAGRAPWVDLEGIEPSQAWLEKLHSAIDAAPAFIFVLSPEAVGSRYCHEEVQRAEDGKKKLIPLLHRPVDPVKVPPALARLQWIPFTPEVNFDAALQDLIRALDTDLEWTERHTRLLVRGREWVAANRDRGHLLRGAALEEAERWLLDSAEVGERRPSPLHAEYIATSRAAAKRSRNRLLAGVSGAAIVALALAAVALQQRNEARENASQALSRQLAAQAQATMEADLGLGALLAVTGYRTRPTFEARQAVARVMRLRPHLAGFYPGHTSRLHRLAFADDGRWLASSAENGRVIVWEVAARTTVFDSTVAGDAAPAVAISGAAEVLAFGGGDGRVLLRPLRPGAPAAALNTRARVRALAFSPDGRLLAVGSDSGTVAVWDWRAGRERCAYGVPRAAPVTALRFATSGATLGSVDYAGSLRRVAVASCAQIGTGVEGLGGSFAALSPDLGRAAATDAGIPEVALADLRSDAASRRAVQGTTRFLLSLALDPRGDRIALGTQAGEILQVDGDLRSVAPPLRGHRSDVTALAYQEGGARLASGSIAGEVIVWDLERTAPLEATRVLPHAGAAALAFSPGGQSLVVALQDGGVVRWALSADVAPERLPAWGPATRVALSPAAERVALLQGDSIVVRAVSGGAVVARIGRTGAGQTDLALGPGGNPLAYVERGRALLVDLEADTVIVAGERTDAHGALTLHAAGDVLAYTAGDDIVLFNRRSGRTRIVSVADAKGPVQALALSPQGDLLATGGNLYDGMVRIRDVATGAQLRALDTQEQMLVARVFFSPDGRTVGAVTAFDNALHLWDVESGQPTLGPVRLAAPAEGGPIVAFSPDGTWMATVEGDGVVLRDLRPASWIASLCEGLRRDPTPAEWREYVGTEGVEPGCPAGRRPGGESD